MVHTDQILNFLRGPYMEGPQQLVGYIPCNLTTGGTANYKGGANPDRYVPMGISGVTIATGIDLGQQSGTSFAKAGIPINDFAVLIPYIGQQKKAAVTALHKQPLKIARVQADVLDKGFAGYYLALSCARYDRDAGAGAFESLPWQAQAAIHSILYQRGCASPKKYPNTWKAFVARDWKDASRRLMTASFWEGYQKRRKEEGKILMELI